MVTLSNTIIIVNCHIKNHVNINDIQKHFSIKIMELNILGRSFTAGLTINLVNK